MSSPVSVFFGFFWGALVCSCPIDQAAESDRYLSLTPPHDVGTGAGRTRDSPPHLVVIFIGGSFLMRSAGVIMNDLADQSFDRQVARTKTRPLASGELSRRQARCCSACSLSWRQASYGFFGRSWLGSPRSRFFSQPSIPTPNDGSISHKPCSASRLAGEPSWPGRRCEGNWMPRCGVSSEQPLPGP